jgi:ribosomal protein L20A (L18A)
LTIDDLVSHLTGYHHIESSQPAESSKIKEIKDKLNQSINYLITDLSSIDYDNDFFNVSNVHDDISYVKRKLKYASHQIFFNLKNILSKYKKKPIFSFEAVEKILHDDIFLKITDDSFLYSVLMAYIYGIIDMRSYIVFEIDLKMLDEDQLDVFLNHILPINGRLSKVILVSPSLVFNSNGIKEFFTFNHMGEIMSYHYDDFKDKYHQSYHCQYIEDQDYKEDYYSDFESIIKLKQKKIKIININTIHYMDLMDLKKVVDTI